MMVEVEVARGRSVMTANGSQGPGTRLQFDPEEAAHLHATGFVKYPDGADPLPAPTLRMREGSPDGTGVLFQGQSWEQQRQAAEAEKAATAGSAG